MDAHQALGGVRPGRRWRTEQINWSLVIRLAGEFQGYCRELHDLGVDHFADEVAGSNVGLQGVLRIQLTSNRRLDKGNANSANLAGDFNRFGFQLWPSLEAAVGSNKASEWRDAVEDINKARNGIAHSDEQKLVELRNDGVSINLTQIRKWYRQLDKLVVAMDDIFAGYLHQFLGGGRPW